MMANQHLIKMKKSKVNQSIISETVNPLLLYHVLSPIELLAITHDFKSFQYKLGNKNYQIAQDYCYYLKSVVSVKIEHFQKLKYSKIKVSKKVKASQTNHFAQFIQVKINDTQISEGLKYRLRYWGYEKVSQLLYDGQINLSKQKGISVADINELIVIMEKNDCLLLFMRRY